MPQVRRRTIAGGGHIIIRARIANAANDPSIKGQLASWAQKRLEAILAKGYPDWTRKDAKFVLKCLDDADESFEE